MKLQPVTCIAARPFPVPLMSDDEHGVQMHALSASADSQLAWLTLQKRSPKRQPSNQSFKSRINSFVKWVIVAWALFPLSNEIRDKCEDVWDKNGFAQAWECIRDDVLIAKSSRPGISVPPH